MTGIVGRAGPRDCAPWARRDTSKRHEAIAPYKDREAGIVGRAACRVGCPPRERRETLRAFAPYKTKPAARYLQDRHRALQTTSGMLGNG